MKRVFLSVLCVCAAALGFAGNINVNSPARGTPTAPTLVGTSKSINFALTNMVNEAKISIKVLRQSDNSVFFESIDAVSVTPSTNNHDGSGTFNLTFAQGTPEVVFRVEVRARDINNETTYNADQDLFVKPDVTKPKILSFNPISNSFVKGIVPIRVRILETNLKEWRVQVDGADIPNNTGSTVNTLGEFVVNWDATGIPLDGSKSISVRIKDLADNEETTNISVTIDRVAPTAIIRAPVNNTTYGAGTSITITVDVRDVSNSSVNVTGVDVVARTTAGTFIVRASRISFQALDANTSRWVGRIRWKQGQLPPTFKIHVTAVDRAGNVPPAPQTVTVRIGS
jgi:hypothetical protein